MPLSINFWQSNPKFMQYLQKHPDGPFARMYEKQFGPLPNAQLMAGSNNAGVAAPAMPGPSNTPSSNPTPMQKPVPFGPGTNNFSAAYPFGVGDQSFNQGFSIPSFAAGGMMSPTGQAIRPGQPVSGGPQLGAPAQKPMDSGQLVQEAQNFARSNPQAAQQVQSAVLEALQSGELTYDELNLAVQLAKTALANPSSYQQVRQFAIQNGLGTEADIPAEYDQGLLFILLVIGQSLQGAGGAAPQANGNAMMGQAPSPQAQQSGVLPEYEDGGDTGNKKHLGMLHPYEIVIDADTVRYHGKKHFDKLVEQARNPNGA